MTMTDPISDYLTRVRNAHIAKHDRADIPHSKQKLELSRILKSEGFIRDYEVLEAKPQSTIRVYLRYTPEGVPAITRIARVSKPGRRIYTRADDIKPVLRGIGLGIISTSKGMMTFDDAQRSRVGGEVICEVW
jgi:small subunit ribosomal protein S8